MTEKLTLEQVHHHIDGVTRERDRLQGGSGVADPIELPALCDAVQDLDLFYGVGPSQQIKAPSKLVRAFTRDFTPVKTGDAFVLASKIVSFLRSIEGELSSRGSAGTPPPPKVELPSSIPNYRALGSVWVVVPDQDDVKGIIAEISLLLDSVLSAVHGSNLQDSQRALTPIDRAQLIAILETALQILKAPMVEKGLLKKTEDVLKDAAMKTVRKQTERGFGQLAEEAIKLIALLISKLPW